MRKVIVAVMLAISLCGCNSNSNSVPADCSLENADRFECEAGQVAIVTDTRTGVQYLVWKCGYGGGMCVLVDADGKPMLAGDAE
jgi:hypothetical protein